MGEGEGEWEKGGRGGGGERERGIYLVHDQEHQHDERDLDGKPRTPCKHVDRVVHGEDCASYGCR